MKTQAILDPDRWAKETFGPSKLKDIRRTGRVVQVRSLMAKNPSGSLLDASPRGRDPKQTTTARDPRNGYLDTAGSPPGSYPAETLAVHVGDRGADLFPFFQACQATHTHFLVRGFEDRRLQAQEKVQGHLLDEVRRWPSIANQTLLEGVHLASHLRL